MILSTEKQVLSRDEFLKLLSDRLPDKIPLETTVYQSENPKAFPALGNMFTIHLFPGAGFQHLTRATLLQHTLKPGLKVQTTAVIDASEWE